jgi:hypothetical protein
MGIALWAGCAVVVLFSARSVPFGRPDRWIWELIATLASAVILGLVATSLDFGGWNEPDWRAGLFVAFGSAAVVGLIRLVRLVRTTRPGVGSRESGVGASNELAPTSARDARSGVGSRESGVGASNEFAPTSAPTSARDARSGVGSRESGVGGRSQQRVRSDFSSDSRHPTPNSRHDSRRPTPAKTPTPHSPLPTSARQQ